MIVDFYKEGPTGGILWVTSAEIKKEELPKILEEARKTGVITRYRINGKENKL